MLAIRQSREARDFSALLLAICRKTPDIRLNFWCSLRQTRHSARHELALVIDFCASQQQTLQKLFSGAKGRARNKPMMRSPGAADAARCRPQSCCFTASRLFSLDSVSAPMKQP